MTPAISRGLAVSGGNGTVRQVPGGLAVSKRSVSVPWWLLGGIAAADCVAAYQPKGAASYSASKVNLVNPGTNDAADGNAPGWSTENGWELVKWLKHYLITTIIPSQNFSVVVRYANTVTSGNTNQIFGSYNGTSTRFYIANQYVDSNTMRWGYGSAIHNIGTPNISAVAALCGGAGYVNGTSVVSPTGTWSGIGRAITIGCLNNNGIYQDYFGGYIQAIVFYNTILSAAQAAAVSAAVAAL